MQDPTSTRRRFVTAAIALYGSASLQPVIVWAQSGAGGRPDADVVRMARLLYPHDALLDDVYAEVLGDAISQAETAFTTWLDEIAGALDAATKGDFLAAGEAAQIAAMSALEDEAAFTAIQAKVRDGLYLHPACWKVVGYGGPSFQDGGYLHRGAGEIDWLLEDE